MCSLEGKTDTQKLCVCVRESDGTVWRRASFGCELFSLMQSLHSD